CRSRVARPSGELGLHQSPVAPTTSEVHHAERDEKFTATLRVCASLVPTQSVGTRRATSRQLLQRRVADTLNRIPDALLQETAHGRLSLLPQLQHHPADADPEEDRDRGKSRILGNRALA